MAVTAIWPIRGRLDRAIAYIKDQEKTYNPAWEQGCFPAISSLMQCAIEQAAAQGMGNAIGYVIDKEKRPTTNIMSAAFGAIRKAPGKPWP